MSTHQPTPHWGPPPLPPASPPPPPRQALSFSPELVVLGLSILCFIFGFMPWRGWGDDNDGALNAYELPVSTAAVVLLLLSGLLSGWTLIDPGRRDPQRRISPLPALLAGVGMVFLIAYIGMGNGWIDDLTVALAGLAGDASQGESSMRWGAIVTLILGVGQAILTVTLLVLKVMAARPQPAPPPPPAPPSYGGYPSPYAPPPGR